MSAPAHDVPVASTGPLAGLRVLDLSIMAAGPWTGALLGTQLRIGRYWLRHQHT